MALTITRIPDRYRPGLARIHGLSIETVSAIIEALGKTPVASTKELISAVEKAGCLTNEEAREIITSLRSLYTIKASAELTVADLVPKIIGAMQASGVQVLAVSEAERPALAEKLTGLLGLSSLERASKIEQLKQDQQTIFYDAKILTDLRPVFDNPKEPPIGAIITYTLKIICHQSGEHKELYFALDAEDVSKLKQIAERAVDKSTSLLALLKSASISPFS